MGKKKAPWVPPEWTLSEKSFEQEVTKIESSSYKRGYSRGLTDGAGEIKLRQVRNASEMAKELIQYLCRSGAQATLRLLFLEAFEDMERVPGPLEPCQPWMHAEPWECKVHAKIEPEEAPHL